MSEKNMRLSGHPGPPGPKSPQPPKLDLVRMLIMGVVFFLLFRWLMPGGALKTSITQLQEAVRNNQVEALEFYPESLNVVAHVLAHEKAVAQKIQARAASSEHLDEIRQLAEAKGIQYVVRNPPTNWGNLVFNILMIGFFIVFLLPMLPMLMGRMGGKGGIGNFTKSPAKHYKQSTKNRKTFTDVAGCDEAKEELQEIVEVLKDPEKFTSLGARMPRGVLMYGPPGNGKTLLARAVAGEAKVPFLFANGAKFVEMFVGVGAARVTSLFEEAKKNAPCIIFIDEIEALGKQRGFAIGGGHDEREQTLNELLSQMDGFETDTRVIVLAATNRPDMIDDALMRPGRFDRHVNVPKPDLLGREAILKVQVKNIKLAVDVNLKDVAKDCIGFSGADLENVKNEAALLATRRGKKSVERVDFSDAIDKNTMGPERKTTKLSKKERKTTAYHEAGHTLVAHLTPGADPVYKVTIIPRGPALGYMKQLPVEDRYLAHKKQLLAQVAVCLGGRVAEELVLDDISSGAGNDLEQANKILKKMIYELGMNEKAGLAVYKGSYDFWGKDTGIDASEKTKQLLEQEVTKALKESHDSVMKLLQENKAKLEALAKALLERETLTAEEVKQVINSPA